MGHPRQRLSGLVWLPGSQLEVQWEREANAFIAVTAADTAVVTEAAFRWATKTAYLQEEQASSRIDWSEGEGYLRQCPLQVELTSSHGCHLAVHLRHT